MVLSPPDLAAALNIEAIRNPDVLEDVIAGASPAPPVSRKRRSLIRYVPAGSAVLSAVWPGFEVVVQSD